jgi:metal-responsive CopG/Arc/MetJ family transcriptional regulator
MNVFMPTTVHIPVSLLDAVDRRAKALRLSRNRLIIRALEREVTEPSGWSPEFFGRLRDVDAGTARDVDRLLAAVTHARRSKRPRDL